MEQDQLARDAFFCEFEELLNDLRGCREIDDTEYSYLLDSVHKVADHILKPTPLLQERIGEIMGGKVLRLRTDEIIEKGLEKGRAEGALSAYAEMIREGFIPVAFAAAKLNMSEMELRKHI